MQIPKARASFAGISDSGRSSHPLRRRKTEHIDAGCENIQRELQEGDPALFLFPVFFRQDLGRVIEAVEIIGKLVNIGAYAVRSDLPVSAVHHSIKTGEIAHKILLRLACGAADHAVLCGRASFLSRILGQDGFDPHDRVQDIGTRVTLERRESLDVEDVILGGLIGEIAVLEGRKSDLHSLSPDWTRS